MPAESIYQGLSGYLEALASRTSTPGGGAVAAVTGAQAAGLVAMVARFSPGLDDIAESAVAATTAFIEQAALDAEGFDALMAAYRVPKDSPDRKAGIQAGLIKAMAAPRAMLKLASAMNEHLPRLVREGNMNLVSDTAMAAVLIAATLETAAMNVRINLKSVRDEETAATITSELNDATRHRHAALEMGATASAMIDS